LLSAALELELALAEFISLAGSATLRHRPLNKGPYRSALRALQQQFRLDKAALQNPLNGTTRKMADPFEVRMRFSSQLQHLNASVASAQKAAQYALKYKDMDEDLHSCILEQVERVSERTDYII
jgi:5-enolpyruvylshikimate-3-phosphate synthase